ncbi:conserved hypothetical protein [Leishmania major strain Friedlin]|uniref:Uncharacterized protein n=1 Tax=Leishmania major TaxID=5664 RepID=E9ACI4_LEIMA|nr:conserved hypothetical protein [Leishmania major strain Friedlin]CAG9567264.1 hypothetical_protein_conserved [Leishmania major strain Friedlin]CBZ12001.1 conserved hypothetical protein [Leishmania major strain Friedlin]|eukprot:XP_003721715.1 conserved hypothetical protein [Leishmania major strain Friedlin]
MRSNLCTRRSRASYDYLVGASDGRSLGNTSNNFVYHSNRKPTGGRSLEYLDGDQNRISNVAQNLGDHHDDPHCFDSDSDSGECLLDHQIRLLEAKKSAASSRKCANPGPVGLLGFGLSTILLNLHNTGNFPLSTVIVAMGICLGGGAQALHCCRFPSLLSSALSLFSVDTHTHTHTLPLMHLLLSCTLESTQIAPAPEISGLSSPILSLRVDPASRPADTRTCSCRKQRRHSCLHAAVHVRMRVCVSSPRGEGQAWRSTNEACINVVDVTTSLLGFSLCAKPASSPTHPPHPLPHVKKRAMQRAEVARWCGARQGHCVRVIDGGRVSVEGEAVSLALARRLMSLALLCRRYPPPHAEMSNTYGYTRPNAGMCVCVCARGHLGTYVCCGLLASSSSSLIFLSLSPRLSVSGAPPPSPSLYRPKTRVRCSRLDDIEPLPPDLGIPACIFVVGLFPLACPPSVGIISAAAHPELSASLPLL